MEPEWITRLREEEVTLRETAELFDFIIDGVNKEKVGSDQWILLNQQYYHMNSYLRILNDRLGHLDGAK